MSHVQFHFAAPLASWHPVQDFNILTNRYLEHHEACGESFDLYDEIHWDNSWTLQDWLGLDAFESRHIPFCFPVASGNLIHINRFSSPPS